MGCSFCIVHEAYNKKTSKKLNHNNKLHIFHFGTYLLLRLLTSELYEYSTLIIFANRLAFDMFYNVIQLALCFAKAVFEMGFERVFIDGVEALV